MFECYFNKYQIFALPAASMFRAWESDTTTKFECDVDCSSASRAASDAFLIALDITKVVVVPRSTVGAGQML